MTTVIERGVSLGDARLPERFWTKVKVGAGDCWLWTAAIDRDGYGHWDHEVSNRVHRVAYWILVGPIPAGLVMDHLCRVRNCVNPAHLRAVTNRENLSAPGSLSTVAGPTATHCIRGHRLGLPNISAVLAAKGYRTCRACSMAYSKRRIAAKHGLEFDLQAASDEAYSRILAGQVGRPGARFTAEKVREILERHAAGATHQTLAEDYGTSRVAIVALLAGKTYRAEILAAKAAS